MNKIKMGIQAVELQTLSSHTSDVTGCDFGADYMLATASSDKTIRIWEWKSGLGYVEVSFSPFKEHKYGITYISFSPQGTMLASCSRDGSTILWNVRNGSKIHKFPQVNGDTVRVCRFLPDSCNLATGGDNGIVCIWDLIHRTLLRTIQHHEDSVQGLSYTADSSFLLTTCTQGVMKLYSVADICDTTISDTAALLSIDDAHDLGVLSCDFSNIIQSNEASMSSYYLLATSGNDHTLIQWILKCSRDVKKNRFQAEINVSFIVKEAHASAITCVRYNQPGNRLCTSSMDKSAKIWDNEGKCLHVLDGHGRYVNCVSFSRDGSFLSSGSNDKSTIIWDLTGESINLNSQITKPCTLLSHFGSGDLKGISTINEESILLLKGESIENEVVLHQTIDIHSAVINSLEFNSDGLITTGSGDKNICLLESDIRGMYSELQTSPIGTHRYQVNCITFIEPSWIASCSLDGNISLWRINQPDTRPVHIWTRSSAGVKCIRGSNFGFLMSAYDDGTAALWSLETLSAEPIVVYPEHAEAATSCACSSDGRLVCSASHNGDFRLFQIPDDRKVFSNEAVHSQEHAHDLGIQCIDFATNNDGLPLQHPEDMSCHLLGTCGNDTYARIWKILIPKRGDISNNITCVEWKVLCGHGSSLTSIRFPKMRADFVCTTSTDMQARIWSVYSAQCLHVLEHNSLVTCCSFSKSCEFLATGCLEGQMSIWKLPLELVYDSSVVTLIKSNNKNISDWNSEDISRWLKETCQTDDKTTLQKIIVRVHTNNITGKHLMSSSEEHILEMLDIDPLSDNDIVKYIVEELHWLKRPMQIFNLSNSCNIPHEFLCPITHDIMRDPVKCADGFTYERKAINEWFLSGGKHVSPMTNQLLYSNEITPNQGLKRDIRQFIYDNVQETIDDLLVLF